ncbi:predicted protein [Naegleria gruberi]|uniref:Predicted protein n=1 Tax=Naegleria gruberi TaxID=5762 RepID=D2VXE6_NAEGR|nr:uncharacterized protein NAEGRDRAFT_73721 [Naegleria gruberi]EFC38425.1 predicted protein [Naegleria gruberi]|eukprot:XP_002671169.1 predicted protein [Naegleria gruberi strain NEG-M]
MQRHHQQLVDSEVKSSTAVMKPSLLSEHVRTSSSTRNDYIDNIQACIDVGEKLKSLLGPKALENLIVDRESGEIIITNDGATAIEYMKFNNPLAQLFIELSQSVDDQIGDGTTSVVVLASSMLEQSLKLIREGVHPMKIVKYYSIFNDIIEKHLTEYQALKLELNNESSKSYITQLVKTTLNSKFSSTSIPNLSHIAVDSMYITKGERRFIKIIKSGKAENSITFRGSSTNETKIISNEIIVNTNFIHENMKENVNLKNQKLALVLFELDKPKAHKSRLDDINSIDNSQIDRLIKEEESYIKKIVVQLKKLGVGLICVQENLSAGFHAGVSDTAKFWLQKSKINCMIPISKDEMNLIADAFQLHAISSIDQLSNLVESGTTEEKGKFVQSIEYVKHLSIGRQSFISFGQTAEQYQNYPCATIVLSAPTQVAVDEVERALHDALRVVEVCFKHPSLVPGGGACEMSLSAYIHCNFLNSTTNSNKCSPLEKLIMASFSNAIEEVPHILSQGCQNHVPSALLNELRHIYTESIYHNQPSPNVGIYLSNQQEETLHPIQDMKERKVFELLHSKISQMKMALQTVQRILKIRKVFISTPPTTNK